MLNMSREKPIITFSLIYTWTVAEGGGDDVWRTLGRLRRERRKSRDVTALPTTAVFVTVPVCSELHSAVIIFHLNDARNLQKTSKHFYNKKSLKNKPLITVLKWIYKNEKLILVIYVERMMRRWCLKFCSAASASSDRPRKRKFLLQLRRQKF